MTYPHPILAREGWPFITLAILTAAVVTYVAGWGVLAGLSWVASLLVLQYFRDPPRVIPAEPGAILSPADGRIVRIEKVRDHYANRDALLISVFMNIFSVHSNRSSVDGVV